MPLFKGCAEASKIFLNTAEKVFALQIRRGHSKMYDGNGATGG